VELKGGKRRPCPQKPSLGREGEIKRGSRKGPLRKCEREGGAIREEIYNEVRVYHSKVLL